LATASPSPAGGAGGYIPPEGYDYYLAPSASGASDSNDGSRSAPFATHEAVRDLLDGLGGSDDVSVFIEGKVFTGEHMSWVTTMASGAVVSIYLGEGYILDGTGQSVGGGWNLAGGSGWTVNLTALGGEENRALIRNFTQASANAIGLSGVYVSRISTATSQSVIVDFIAIGRWF